MLKKTAPETVYVPVPNYVAATIVPPNATWIHVSGQVGFDRSGCPEDFESQMAIAMDNILAVLRDADMGAEDIVKLTFNIVDRADLAALRKVRDEKLGGVYVASTILVVAGFALPELKVEIDCVAAK
jgi:2-iminobutanoate/2-iminopropanoate deaminase